MKLQYNFYSKPIAEIAELIDKSVSFTVMGVRDFGRSAFLKKFISEQTGHRFILVDVYDLSDYSRLNLWRLLYKKLTGVETEKESETEIISLCQNEIFQNLKNKERVVIVMNRIDLVTFKIDDTFFAQLRALQNINPKKVSFIFGTCQKINQVSHEQISGSNILFFSHIYYLPLFEREDLLTLASDYGLTLADPEVLERAIALSGGHFQLFQLLLKKNFSHNSPLKDEFILLALKSIYANLNHTQKLNVQKVSKGKAKVIDDDYLIQTRMISQINGNYQLFSPLFTEFVLSYTSRKMPVKEKKLFTLLKQNLNTVVQRDEIFKNVWGEDDENATDWALDALVYRLRKNKVFQNSGYSLENHKKQGYSLE